MLDFATTESLMVRNDDVCGTSIHPDGDDQEALFGTLISSSGCDFSPASCTVWSIYLQSRRMSKASCMQANKTRLAVVESVQRSAEPRAGKVPGDL